MEGIVDSKPCVKFEVEKVIGISADGTYQVQWAPAWVSKFHLVGCEHLIQEFLQEQQGRNVNFRLEPQDSLQSSMMAPNPDDPDLNKELSPSRVMNISNGTLTRPVEAMEIKSELDDQVEEPDTNTRSASEERLPEQGIAMQSEAESELRIPGVELGVYKEKHDLDIDVNSGDLSDLVCLPSKGLMVTLASQMKVYEATNAQKQTVSTSSLNDRVYKQKGPFVCTHCDYSCSKKSRLMVHTRTHTGEKPFSCEKCDYKSAKKQNLKAHMRTHTNKRPYCCKVCKKAFKSPADMKRHTRTHSGQRPYFCDRCHLSFTQAGSLHRHRRLNCPATVLQ